MKIKPIITLILIFLIIGLGIYYFYSRNKSQISFTEVPIQQSNNIAQIPKPGNSETIIIDFSKCSPGRDTVNFGSGSTYFVFEGIKNNRCILNYSLEVEMSGYGPFTKCSVPTSFEKKTFKNGFGVELNELQAYCTKSK